MVKIAGTTASLVFIASSFVNCLPLIKTTQKRFSIEESKRLFPQFKEGAQMVAKCAIEAQEKERNFRNDIITKNTFPSTSTSIEPPAKFSFFDNSASFLNNIPLSQSKLV